MYFCKVMAANNSYATIFFHIDDKNHSGRVSMKDYDIRELKELLENVDMLLSSQSKDSRATVSYSVDGGSVLNKFLTTRQMAIQLSAVLSMVAIQNSLDGLELRTARSFENIQQIARKRGYEFEIYSSEKPESILKITPQTDFHIKEDVWVDAEFYLYGTLVDAGGKNTSNIHITTEKGKNYTIATTREQLRDEERNLLYKFFGVRASGKQKLDTGEIKEDSLQLIELLTFNPVFNEKYIGSLIKKATPKWADVKDVDEWVRGIRGHE